MPAVTKGKTKPPSFLNQAVVLALASLFVRFVGFLYRVPLTDLLGDTGNGYYGTGYNFYLLVYAISSAGLPAAISKMVSERIALKQYRNAHQVFKVAMLIALVVGTAGAIFMAIGANWLAAMSQPEAVYVIRTLSPTVLIVAVMAVVRGYFQGMQNTMPTAMSQVVEQIFNAIFSLWLAHIFFNAAHIEFSAAGGTAGTGIGAAAGLLFISWIYAMAAPRLRRRVRRDRDTSYYEPRGRLAVELIRTALPIILGSAIFSITNLVDMSMVSARLTASGAFSPEEILILYGQLVGKYVLLTTLPVSLSTALATAAIPSIAHSFILKERSVVRNKINMAIRISMLISIPAAVGLGVLSDPVLKLLFPQHAQGGALLRWGVAGIIFMALSQIVTGVLQGIDRVNIPMIGALCGVAVKIPINYFLIADPNINIVGVVISTCICYFVASGVNIAFLYKYTRITPDLYGAIIKPLLASTVMGMGCYISYQVIMYLTSSNTASTLLSVVLGLLLYIVFMTLIDGFRREDLAMLPMGDKIIKLLRV
jgi:stage V sporulation protein B